MARLARSAGRPRSGRQRNDLLDAVADDPALQRQPPPERGHRPGGAIFRVEAEGGASGDDDEDDARVDPAAKGERKCGSEDEDEDERAFELPDEEPNGQDRMGN